MCAMPGHLKNTETNSSRYNVQDLASPMFCLQYMISSYLFFPTKQRISFKQKVFFLLFFLASQTVPILQKSPQYGGALHRPIAYIECALI